MKFKSRAKSLGNPNIINNSITTFNLKIKDIHILIDDITTGKASKNCGKIKRAYSLQSNNDFLKKYSSNTYNNPCNIVYNRKKLCSKKAREEKDKSLKSIPISFRKSEPYKNTESSLPSFLTTMEGFYHTNLSKLLSDKINLNATIFSDQMNYDDVLYKFDNSILKNDIYIKKNNDNKYRYKYRRSVNQKNISPIIIRNKILDNIGKRKKLYNKSKTLTLNPNKDSIETKSEDRIKKKKIKFNINKEAKNINMKNKYHFIFNSKYIITIQKWWKKLQLRRAIERNAILIQKSFRYFLRKRNNNSSNINNKNQATAIKIPKNNNFHNFYCATKIYFRNNIPSIILIQRYFKNYLTRNNFHNLLLISNNPSYLNSNFQKPESKPCFITKTIINRCQMSLKNITFAKKKINTIFKKKRNLKYKSLINNYNSFSYNFKNKNYNLKSDENSILSFNNSESHDFNNDGIINKITYEILNQKNINNIQQKKKADFNLFDLFVRSIFCKLSSVIFQVGYKYKSLLNFITSIELIFIKYKLVYFFENLSFFNTRKMNFIRNINRHINIYQRNNYIKNEIIELIEKNISQEINYKDFDYRKMKFTYEQENNLINTQIFKEDSNLINYIYLFFKYEKKKKVKKNFIENRLIKEPLNYRNIFTILRYIDNLDEKINSNNICTNCFCKINEKVCFLNCTCHFLVNVINMKSLDFKYQIKKRYFNTYQIGEENIENNPNLLNAEDNNNSNIKNISNDIHCNIIKGIRINKTFHYFNK